MPQKLVLKIAIICTVLLLFKVSNASASDTLYFVGNIKTSKKVHYKYNLRFVIDKDSKVTGYSLSDPAGPNEIKTRIFGTYDSSTNILSYEEKGILRSKIDINKKDLCFMKASLKFKKNKMLDMLSGKFTATDQNNGPCSDGEVKLINSDRYKIIMKELDQKDSAKAARRNPDKTIKIDDEKGKELLITGDKIKLTIWDNGQIDQDRISILLNDKYILENYTLTSVTKVIEITLPDMEINTLKIVALNEGTLPPNTAAIKIETALEQYPILTQAKLNEVRTIFLKKKP